jgi:hypothetical protein
LYNLLIIGIIGIGQHYKIIEHGLAPNKRQDIAIQQSKSAAFTATNSGERADRAKCTPEGIRIATAHDLPQEADGKAHESSGLGAKLHEEQVAAIPRGNHQWPL